MKIALGQFCVSKNYEENYQTIFTLMDAAEAEGAKLLVLPENVLARDDGDKNAALNNAQNLDGPFVSQILQKSQNMRIAVAFTLYIKATEHFVDNVQIVIKNGKIIGSYTKLHLYDAFNFLESTNVRPGDKVAPLVEIDGFKFGLMTCYDVRFPELARNLVLAGADALLLPAAWLRGPHKEKHWQVMITARALENTCYVIGVGECGPRNIGHSMVVDPMGVAIVKAGEAPTLLYAELSKERIADVRRQLPVLENRRFGKILWKEE